MFSENFRRPLVVGGSIETNLTPDRLPDADEHSCKARLPGSARPYDAQAAASVKCEICVVNDNFLVARVHDAHALNSKGLRRCIECHGRSIFGKENKQLIESMPALSRRDKALPVRDSKIHGRQRARAENRTG